MPRDYKHRSARSRARKRQTVPGWLWLATGLTIGLFIAFLVYLNKIPVDSQDVAVTQKNNTNSANETKRKNQQKKSEQHKETEFSFYSKLPTMEVTLPAEPQHRAPPKSSKITSPPAVKGSKAYVLQAGSFRKYKEADSLKARLALLGFEATIITVTTGIDSIWHRVRIGPFVNAEQAKKTQDKISRNKITTILLKVSG